MSRHIGAKRKRKICRIMEAELEVQRTIKRSELTAFFCFLKKVIGPIKVHVDNKGVLTGYGEEKEKALVRKQEMRFC